MLCRMIRVLPAQVFRGNQQNFGRRFIAVDSSKVSKAADDVLNNKWFHRVIKYGPKVVKSISFVITHGPKIMWSTVTFVGIGYLLYIKNLYSNKYAQVEFDMSKIYETMESIQTCLNDTVNTVTEGFTNFEINIKNKKSQIEDKMAQIKDKSSDIFSHWFKKSPSSIEDIPVNEDKKTSPSMKDRILMLKDSFKKTDDTSNSSGGSRDSNSADDSVSNKATYRERALSLKDKMMQKLNSADQQKSTSASDIIPPVNNCPQTDIVAVSDKGNHTSIAADNIDTSSKQK